MIMCPACGFDVVEIEATILTLVSSTGIDDSDIRDENVRPHWAPATACRCQNCDHTAQVKDFITPDSPWYDH